MHPFPVRREYIADAVGILLNENLCGFVEAAVKPLRIRLFGGFELRRGSSDPLALRSSKAAALIAFLAVHPGRDHPRERIAGLLWDDRPEVQARASLRQLLHVLRLSLADQPLILETRPDWLALESEGVTVDVDHFQKAIAKGGPKDLVAAVDLYRGDFFDVGRVRSEAFETWLAEERQRLRCAVLDAMHALLETVDPSLRGYQHDVANRALSIDPAHEAAHRVLMRHYVAAGRRAEALRQYLRCRDVLWRELSARPDPVTESLYHAILEPRGAELFG